MSKYAVIIVAALAIVVVVAMLVVNRQTPTLPVPVSDSDLPKAPNAGSVTLSGQSWRLQEARGKVVLLDFWATWCGPCVASIPEIKELYNRFKTNDDFILVGVSLDDDRVPLQAFVKERQLGWMQLFDRAGMNEMSSSFNVRQIPTTILINREGNIVGRDMPYDQLVSEIERLLKEKS